MKIELIQIEGDKPGTKKTVGWHIIAETTDDKRILGSMRHVEFWGSDENTIQYDGYTPDPNDDNYVGSLHYGTVAYKAQKHNELMARIQQEIESEEVFEDGADH